MKISFKSLLMIVATFIEKLFGGAKKFKKFLEEHVDDGIAFVTQIREMLDSDVAKTTIEILPEKWKNRIADANVILGKIIGELSVGEACLMKETADERMECLLQYLSTKKPLERTGMFFKIVYMWVKYASGTEAKESAIDTAVQNRLFAKKNNLLAA